MGKKGKIGKQRRDRYYYLAKETGFRSRAAFKLLQLNRKFEFLQKSRVLIDLCAAPGGWMQVAKQNMPVSSVVIGIDMYPMKPLPGCIALQEDITTEKCRVALQKEIKTWKADVVLHDGAPNVGKNWLHDAYTQSCLTLSALKLATQFLKKGGWFVTKVFRSKDYNSLLWVFNQLFKKVHSTKPSASRNESAEIFVVCQHYLCPDQLDKKFLNPEYVFKELEMAPTQNILKASDKIKKQKAEGYPDDTTILYKKMSVREFVNCKTPIVALQELYEIVLDDPDICNHASTTDEIKRCCEDIKVLGRKELRSLLAWWKIFQKKDEKDDKETPISNEGAKKDAKDKNVDSEEDEEKMLEDVDTQIAEMADAERRELKRKRKKANLERAKLQIKMNLSMRHKGDLGPTEQADQDVFQLSHITSNKAMTDLMDKNIGIEEEEEVPKKLPKKKRVKYDAENSYLDKSGIFYTTKDSDNEESSSDDESEKEDLDLEEDEEIPSKKKKKFVSFADEHVVDRHPLITDLDTRDPKDKRLAKAELWFDKDLFKNIETEEDENYELDKMSLTVKSQEKVTEESEKPEENDDSESDDDDSISDDDESDIDDYVTAKKEENEGEDIINEWDVNQEVSKKAIKKKKKEKKMLSDDGLALGTMMVNSIKTKRDIVDEGWNRYAFNDENLPDWFVQDEKIHMIKPMPVPKELVEEYTKRKEELNIRPIKKVVEARARKKKAALRKMTKMKKKMEGLMENPDVTQGEKAREIRKMYKKLKGPKPEVKYIVAKKHNAAKRVRRPKGLKGPYKVVDPRLKKDMRAKARKDGKSKSSKKGRNVSNSKPAKRSKSRK